MHLIGLLALLNAELKAEVKMLLHDCSHSLKFGRSRYMMLVSKAAFYLSFHLLVMPTKSRSLGLIILLGAMRGAFFGRTTTQTTIIQLT